MLAASDVVSSDTYLGRQSMSLVIKYPRLLYFNVRNLQYTAILVARGFRIWPLLGRRKLKD